MSGFVKGLVIILSVFAGICAVVVLTAYMGRWSTVGTIRDVKDMAKETISEVVTDFGDAASSAELAAWEKNCLKRFGVEKGSDIFERVRYLDQLFKEDSFSDIFSAVDNEVNRQLKDNESFDFAHAYYLLSESAKEGRPQRFSAFLAQNKEVFAKARTSKVTTAAVPEAEGESQQAISPKDTYYNSRIDPTTGEPVTARRTISPGYQYSPVEQEPDAGHNTRKVTPGL